MLPSPKPNDTPTYTGVPSPDPNQAGTTSTAGWANNLVSPPWWNVPNEVLEGVRAPVRVTLPSGSNPTVTKIGFQQYADSISLSGRNTLQLTPGMADAQQNDVTAVTPNRFIFTYISRNVAVATVNSSGIITATGRGQVEILIGTARQANEPLAPTAVEVYASLIVTVVA